MQEEVTRNIPELFIIPDEFVWSQKLVSVKLHVSISYEIPISNQSHL